MDEKKWTEADAQIPIAAHVIDNVAGGISKAADNLDAAVQARK
jgi:ABC-type iron transport system FetAB permease component